MIKTSANVPEGLVKACAYNKIIKFDLSKRNNKFFLQRFFFYS